MRANLLLAISGGGVITPKVPALCFDVQDDVRRIDSGRRILAAHLIILFARVRLSSSGRLDRWPGSAVARSARKATRIESCGSRLVALDYQILWLVASGVGRFLQRAQATDQETGGQESALGTCQR